MGGSGRFALPSCCIFLTCKDIPSPTQIVKLFGILQQVESEPMTDAGQGKACLETPDSAHHGPICIEVMLFSLVALLLCLLQVLHSGTEHPAERLHDELCHLVGCTAFLDGLQLLPKLCPPATNIRPLSIFIEVL